MWRQCMKDDSWGYMDNAFLVGLVSPGQVLQHKDSKRFHLVTNMVDGKAALSLNLVKKTINGISLLTWQQGPGLMPYSWVCVLRDDAYITYRISHVGHAWRILYPQLCGGLVKSVPPKDFNGPYIKMDSGALTLHTGAAYKAYNKFGIAAMKGFANDAGVEMPPVSDLFDYVDVMCRHHLKDQKVSEVELIDILANRFEERADDDIVKDILGTKECAEGFGEEELKVLENWKSNREKIKKDNAVSRGKLNEKRKVYAAKTNDAAKKSYKTKMRGLVSDGSRIYGKILSSGSLQEWEALHYLPPGSTVQRSVLDNRCLIM